MANITLSTTESNIVVDASNNIIQVSSTPTTIVVGESVAQVSNADIRAALSNTSPILYNSTTGVFSFDSNATFTGKTTDDLAEGSTNLYFTGARTVTAIENNFVTLKGYKETVYNNGNLSGNITLDASLGSIHTVTMTGNITNIAFSNFVSGSSITIVLKQDVVGYRELITSGWSNWYFVSDNTQLVLPADSINILNVVREGSNYYASLSDFASGTIPNSQLANSNITINGVTINLGSSGTLTTTNIAEGTNLYFTAARARGNVSATSATGISYNSGTGVFSLASIPNSSLTNSAITINGTSVALGGTRTLTTSDIAEGTNLYFTAARANSNVVSYIATVPLTVGGNLTVNGNINATGNINYQNVTDLYVTDQKITLNSNAATNANVEIISNRPTATSTSLKWNEQATRWEFTNNGTTYYPIPASTTDLAEGSNLWFTAARTNTAIDNYLIGGTGISYSSGTIALDFTEFSTTNIAEGSNLWFSNARVNSFIQDNITTTDIDEGTNLYYTTDRANTAIGAYQGSISTPGNISAGNVITTSIHSNGSSNITINSNTNLIVRETVKGVSTQVGNINGGGYAIFTGTGGVGRILDHTGTTELTGFAFATGNTTSGSNVITNVTLVDPVDLTTPSSLSAVTQYYAWDYNFGLGQSFPFPPGTYVQSVDAGNSTITMSQPAAATTDLDQDILLPQNIIPGLFPGAFDVNTGLLLGLISTYNATGGGSKTAIAGQIIMTQGKYGYPATGPVPADFVYSLDTASNYSVSGLLDTDKLIARTQVEAPRTVMNFPRGLTVGDADLTNRAENDGLPSFGLNVLWDGLSPASQYADGTPLTQVLVKNYTDNNLQSLNRTTFGPRLFFTASEGNKNQSYVSTYPRKNLELGRISWWSPSQSDPQLGTTAPPAWISGVTGQDNLTTNSGAGMFFGISPNTANFNRSLFLASSMGNTLIASAQDSTGAHRPIIFAPSHIGSSQGNSALLYNQTIDGTDLITDTVQTSGAHFAQINFANTSALTGAKISVTNGNNTNSTREGNITLSIDRNLTSANSNVRVRIGGVNFIGTSNPDRIRFSFAPQGLVDGTAVTINNFVVAPATTLNGNVFYVKGPFVSGSFRDYELYYDSGLTSGVNLGTTNISAGQGTFEYTRNNAVTAKEWSWVLPQGSNNLILAEDGVTRATFSNTTGDLTITGRHTYDRVYGEFCYTGGNITPVAADTIYAFPFDTTNMSSDVVANNTSRINITKPGIFKLITSIQVDNTGNTTDNILNFWLRKNGTDVANSTTQVDCLKLQKQVIAMDWMVESDGDDYFEIVYFVNSTEIVFPYVGPQTSPVTYPATPPIIVNVIPVGA
jgi:hypothetical protein